MQQLEDSRVRGVLKSIGVAEGKIQVKAEAKAEVEEQREPEHGREEDASWMDRFHEVKFWVGRVLDFHGIVGHERVKYATLAHRLLYLTAAAKIKGDEDRLEEALRGVARFHVEYYRLKEDVAREILLVIREKLLND